MELSSTIKKAQEDGKSFAYLCNLARNAEVFDTDERAACSLDEDQCKLVHGHYDPTCNVPCINDVNKSKTLVCMLECQRQQHCFKT